MATLTKGPLPSRVYWRRRLVAIAAVLLLAGPLVLGLGRLLGSGSDASGGGGGGGGEQARQVAGAPRSRVAARTPTVPSRDAVDPGTGAWPSAAPVSVSPTAGAPGTEGSPDLSSPPTPPASPTGSCRDADIVATPSVPRPVAGRGVRIVLELRTITAQACTWRVSPRHLTMKITSGSDEVWTSWQCPGVMPKAEVVVRRDESRRVHIVWNARRSEDGCPRPTEWALPGYYRVAAAALGGEPSEVPFRLRRP